MKALKQRIGLAALLVSIGVVAFYAATAKPPVELTGTGKTIIDFHTHVAGLGYGNSGCFINQEMRGNIRFPLYLWAMGVSLDELEAQGDSIVVKKVSDAVAQSTRVDKAVILAMDGVIDAEGNLDKNLTQIYIPNEYVFEQTQQYLNLYGDISSLTQVNKLGFMHKVVNAPELQGRLIYGTDWPLQFFPLVSPLYHLGDINLKQAIQISLIRNQWDRDVALKRAMGVKEDVFQWSDKLFKRG